MSDLVLALVHILLILIVLFVFYNKLGKSFVLRLVYVRGFEKKDLSRKKKKIMVMPAMQTWVTFLQILIFNCFEAESVVQTIFHLQYSWFVSHHFCYLVIY